MGSRPSPLALVAARARARRPRRSAALFAAALILGSSVPGGARVGAIGRTTPAEAAATPANAAVTAQNLAPYVPTPQDVVDRMLELAQVTKGDVVYDLGCGDGRIVITAAKKYGARGVGIDIDPARIAEARAAATQAGVADLVEFREQDAQQADVSPASVVLLSLLPQFNLKLRPILTRQLKPGARIVSLQFDMGNWPPAKRELFTDANGATRPLFLWTADGTVR